MIYFQKIVSDIKRNASIYVLLLLLMIISDDNYWFGTSDVDVLKQLKFVFLGLLPFVLLFYKNSLAVGAKDGIQVMYLIVALVFMSSLLNSPKIINGSTLVCFLLASGCYIARKIPLQSFLHCFSNIVLVVCIYSLILFILCQISIIHANPVENMGGSIVYSCNGCVFLTPNGIIFRNAALFREPGMFIIYICLAYLFDICTMAKVPFTRIIIYGLAVFSSYSTAGYLVFGLLLVLQFYNAGDFKRAFFFVLLIISLVAFIYVSDDLFLDVFGKLTEGTDNGSTLSRWASTIIPLYIIPDNFLFGCGLEGYVDLFNQLATRIFHSDDATGSTSSNTILSASAIWGVWMGVFLIISIWKFSNKLSKRKQTILLIFLIIVLLYSNEVRYLSIYTYIIVFYGLSRRYEKKKNLNVIKKSNAFPVVKI